MAKVIAEMNVPRPAYVTIAPKFLKNDLFFIAKPAWKTMGGSNAKKKAPGENRRGFAIPAMRAIMPTTIPRIMAHDAGGIVFILLR